MATLRLTVCDECRKEARRVVRIHDGCYCSRDCYLAVCKRLYDLLWSQALKGSIPEQTLEKTKQRFIRVA